MPDRLFAIGDIHGCSTALRVLIEAIGPRPDDTIIVLGDVIDFGPDSRGAVQQLIDLSRRCRFILLQGNHEETLFSALDGPDDLRYWDLCGGTATRLSYPDRDDHELIDLDHLRFLREICRDYFETDDVIFVQASYHPDRPMSGQDSYTLRWEGVQPDRMRPHFSGKPVIAGHTCRTDGEVLDLGFLKLIDTDASRGGWLTALEVYTGEIIQTNQEGQVRGPDVTPT